MNSFMSWFNSKLKSGTRYAAVAIIAALVAVGSMAFADTPSNVKIQEHFPPALFDAQSCEPEQNADGGCSWDIGVQGSRNDILGRGVTQVGIVKGFSISWGNNVADSDPDQGCALVVLNPNSWFENLNIMDGRMEIYDVDVTRLLKTSDQDRGWLYKLAVQAAQEQAADYGCPDKKFAEINRWGSDIPSPPCGVEGFGSCDKFGDQTDNNGGDGADQNQDNGTNQGDCTDPATINGCERRASINYDGNVVAFKKGEAVAGFKIVIGGKTYQNCFFRSAPGNGKVTDGVVNYWKDSQNNEEDNTSGRC